MIPSFDIKDKVFAITGGAGILCSEMARELALAGAKVAVLDLAGDKASALAAEIRDAGGVATGFACNVLEKESVTAARDAVLAEFGRVDCLINGAGGNHPRATANKDMSFLDIPEEAMQFVVNLNFMGTLLPCQVFGATLAQQKSGSIINISSMAAIRPLTMVVGYGAAKAAVSNFTQWLATWFAKNVSPDIRVNAIAPGFLLTQQNYYLLIDRETGESTPRGAHILAQTPMGRYGKPEELVGAVMFLASPAASFITGTVIPIDGGFSVFAI
jgi:NAD(P)-dependent dehydrogenase (short-subunit alcohol dehydrogenase family)